MNNFQIIESGYNTDYLYSLFIAIFGTPMEGSGQLLNLELDNPDCVYILEMIRMKIIESIQQNKIIESKTINRLRVMLYNAGWMRDCGILTRRPIEDFYKFFVNGLMNYNIEFSVVDLLENQKDRQISEKKISHISLDDSLLIDGNISNGLTRWLDKNIASPNTIYSFKELPVMIPIAINHNNDRIDLMEAIRFNNIGDKLQRLFLWEIYSMICLDDCGYYCVIRSNINDLWVIYRDGEIPSNKQIQLNDPIISAKIKKDLRFCFYWACF